MVINKPSNLVPLKLRCGNGQHMAFYVPRVDTENTLWWHPSSFSSFVLPSRSSMGYMAWSVGN